MLLVVAEELISWPEPNENMPEHLLLCAMVTPSIGQVQPLRSMPHPLALAAATTAANLVVSLPSSTHLTAARSVANVPAVCAVAQ